MSVVLITSSKNGADNIDSSRQQTNKSNLDEAIKLWEEITKIDDSKYLSFKDFESNNKDLNELITKTIPSRLKKNYILYGMSTPNDISWLHIKRMAEEYLNASEWLQINFCKDSTRQSVDEKVQRKMLNENLKDINFIFEKCTPSKTVYGGKLLSKAEYRAADPEKTRKDIDTYGSNGNVHIWFFQKYAKVSGGHQDNVVTETQHFLNDAGEFVSTNKSDDYFIAQLDGKFIEEQISHIRNSITLESRIFAGNSEEVISWIRKNLN